MSSQPNAQPTAQLGSAASRRIMPSNRRLAHFRPWLFWSGLALLLMAICAACVAAAPQRIARTADAGDAERFFYGLGGREQNAAGGYRWSGTTWGVALFGAAYTAPTLVTLHASASRPIGVPEAQLRLVGSAAAAAFPVRREPRRYRLLARPTSDANARQRVDFVGTTFTPDTSDGRTLGIAVSQIEIVQLGSPLLAALLARSLFLAGIAFGLAAAVRQIGMPRAASLAAGVLAAAALGGLQWRATQALGFLLPNAWFLLAAAGAALLVLPIRRACGYVAAQQPSAANRRNHWPALAGFALCLFGTIALWLHLLPLAFGLGIAVVGALATVFVLQNNHRPAELAPAAWLSKPLPALSLITLVALAARVYRLNEQPLALWRDEVYHAELALRIWRDASFRPVYVPEVDLPALLFYLIAPPIGLFGADYWTLRLVPALAGALTPLALWFALRPMLGQRVALIAAWCMAVAAWSLYMSRWTFPVIFDPLFTLLAVGCLWRGLGPQQATAIRNKALVRRLWLCGMGGMCTGLVVYTYHTGRIEPLVVAMFALARLWHAAVPGTAANQPRPHRLNTYKLLAALVSVRVAVALVAFSLTVAPLALFALNNPEAFSKRFATVSIFNGADAAPTAPLTVLQDQLARHALMWHVRGDQNARHHAPFRPMIDPFSGALLLIGLGVCVLASRQSLGGQRGPNGSTDSANASNVIAPMLLCWLAIGLIPGILSDVAPHAMRTIGALAPTCALVAVGLNWLIERSALPSNRVRHGIAFVSDWRHLLVVGVLASIAAWNVGIYFSVTGNIGENYYAFETQRSLFARAARTTLATHPNASVYLPEVLRQGKAGQATTLLLDDAPVGWLDGATLEPPAHETALIMLPGDDANQIAAAQQALGPAARLLRTGPPIPNQQQPIYRIYGVGRDAQQIANEMRLP